MLVLNYYYFKLFNPIQRISYKSIQLQSPKMDPNNNIHIYEQIDRIINCIHNNPSIQLKEYFHDFSKKVFSNGAETRNGSSENIVLKIATKVENTQSHSQAKHRKNILNQFVKNNAFEGRHQILEMLFQLSQLTDKDIPEMFQIKKDFTISEQMKFNSRSQQRQIDKFKQTEQTMRIANKQYESIKSNLVKQLFFVFTNTSSQQIIENGNGYELKNSIDASESLKEMVSEIADLGWLHQKIVAYKLKEGTLNRAFRQALQYQLKQYYLWNNTIEALIKTNQIPMRKLYIASFHPWQILKWLAIIVEAVQPFDGCHIISIINSFRPRGQSAVNQLLNRLIAYMMRPLLNYIKIWMYMGELIDKRNEFFIKENSQATLSEQWQLRFQLIHQNIPNILSLQSAFMILNTGKSLNFLRNICNINYNIKTPFMEIQDIEDIVQQDSNTIISQSFMGWLTAIYSEVNKVLVQTLFNRFNLKYHLISIKHFYLMGKGDFIQHLYDTLKHKLTHKNKDITQYSLHPYVSDAISKCFSNFKIPNQDQYFRSQIVDRLLPKKINFGIKSGIQGWDFFNFQYSLKGLQPLCNIFSPQTIMNYQKIFSFLWKLKQIKEILKEIWFLQSRQGAKKIKRARNKSLFEISHYVYLLRNSMNHFITNLQSYIMVAIQSSWNKFWQQIELIRNFDDILKIHRKFQQQLLQITLTNKQQQSIETVLSNIFTSIINFKATYLQLRDNIDQYCHQLREYEDKLSKSKHSISSQISQIPQSDFRKSFRQIKQVKVCFDQGLKYLYLKMNVGQQSGLNILKAKLNFSSYYSYLFME